MSNSKKEIHYQSMGHTRQLAANAHISNTTEAKCSDKLQDVTAQGAIGTFMARSNSKASRTSEKRTPFYERNLNKMISEVSIHNTLDKSESQKSDFQVINNRRKSQDGTKFKPLPQLSSAQKNQNYVAVLPRGLQQRQGSIDNSVDKLSEYDLRFKVNKRPTCPTIDSKVDFKKPLHSIILSRNASECRTPTKEDKNDEEVLENDSNDNGSVDSGTDEEEEEEDLEAVQQKIDEEKQRKLEEIREFAKANGFDLEEEKPKVKPKRWVPTKEALDKQEELDRELFRKEKYEPPALDMLKKKYTHKEPIRTGFNQGFLPFRIKNNYEAMRTPQGPQIVVTSSSMQKRREREVYSSASERSSRAGKRSLSRESSIPKLDQNSFKNVSVTKGETLKDFVNRENSTQKTANAAEVDENEKQQIHVHQNMNMETSLRHLFYMEYKQNFPEGQSNPIIYSRFGKHHFNSNEKFDMNNFNQLLRTCNLKKILKSQENGGATSKDRKYSEPISFPSCDYYKPKNKNDKTLVFESRFESGNLQLAHKVNDNEYDLILQNDINSKGHTQWFFFRVANVKKGLKVKFNMLNMIKSKSLYNEGMKVLIYSQKNQEMAEQIDGSASKKDRYHKGWMRGGDDLGYFQNNYKKEQQTNFQRCYYTFTFTHTFEHDDDLVYFAYSVPYTYSNLCEDLCEIQSRGLNYVTRNTLCRTIAGNKCEYLTITNRVPFEVDQKKEGVVITSRIHPGESNSSFMMKGVIDFLISDCPEAIELRDKFVFKIIPMLNPDGVINGNYRCSLAGCDLNRRWKYPSEMLHPVNYHTKKLIQKLSQERPLALYADLHGHSRRKNIFMYGNGSIEEQDPARVFPFLMSKIAQPHFSYDYSRFNIGRNKEQTARVAVWRDLGSRHCNIFTMEASFCGPKVVKHEPHRKKAPAQSEINYHFTTEDLEDAGKKLCETVLLYRNEKDSTMGLQNVQYQIDQYHVEKEAKIEQEELIRQQQALFESRKQQEMQSRMKQNSNMGNVEKEEEVPKAIVKVKEFKEPAIRDTSITKGTASTKKARKPKVEKLPGAEEDEPKTDKKKKVNYNCRDSSDGASDSEPSEDNLDSEQIMKLIPKKYGKTKYLKGLEETKKKKPPPEPKPEKKKPKTVLMPCMSIKKEQEKKKEEIKSQRNNSESAAKKQPAAPFKYITTKMRVGGKQRDVGTHIRYTGDGRNLSLMEIDILRTTGAKWSKIIYSGYRGYIKPQDKQEIMYKSPIFDKHVVPEESISPRSTSNFGAQQFMSSFNSEYSKIVDGIGGSAGGQGLRNVKNPSQSSDFSATKIGYGIGASPFKNESIKQQTQGIESGAIKNLQQKIMETNFTEARSLFGGNTQGKINPLNQGSNKKRVIGMPFDYSKSDCKPKYSNNDNIFDLNLETVQERVKESHEKNSITIDYTSHDTSKSLKYNKRNHIEGNLTKKVVNGAVVTQQKAMMTSLQVDSTSSNGIRLRQKSINDYPTPSNSGPMVCASKIRSTSSTKNQNSSFANVAQQILNVGENIPQTNLEMNEPKFSDLVNLAPSQMMSKLVKIQNNIARNSQLSNKK